MGIQAWRAGALGMENGGGQPLAIWHIRGRIDFPNNAA